MGQKAVCLLSGGLDSATVLYEARHQGYEVFALTISYGQLHGREIESARALASGLKIEHRLLTCDLSWKGSALLDPRIPIPSGSESPPKDHIPSTYVPGRNSIFLALASSWAEAIGAEAVFIGANAVDYSGYPDCRPEYLEAMEKVFRIGTKAGIEGRAVRIIAPLVRMTKAEIIRRGQALKVPFEKTWSCYRGGKIPCGDCDSCLLRARGFREAGWKDPLVPA
ncbi:MAG: 7-cyano-7-deazaguanine synthase QueC [Candidatus Omnitrophota bacterium]